MKRMVDLGPQLPKCDCHPGPLCDDCREEIYGKVLDTIQVDDPVHLRADRLYERLQERQSWYDGTKEV